MRTLTLIGAAALATSLLTASAGTIETYDFSGFDALDIAAGISVEFKTSETYSVVADFKRGGPDDIKIRQSGDRLYISRKSGRGWGNNKARVTVTVTAPSLEAIEASSGSDLEAEGLRAADLEIDVSSGASVRVSGTCTSLDIQANSGGDARARNMICSSVKAKASSGGSLRAHASEAADSHTSSGGSVVIYGDPAEQHANKSISGGSTDFR